MKKLVRKGFSVVELLFVMVLIASLSAIAIQKFSTSSESVIITSMHSDTRNAINYMQSLLVIHGVHSFLNIGFSDKNIVFSQTKDNGLAKSNVTVLNQENIAFSVSKGNKVTIRASEAGEGTCTYEGEGFEITVSNSDYPWRAVTFNSCTDGKPKVIKGK